jgi:ribosomal protein S12 methylthiotransferase accessory factor
LTAPSLAEPQDFLCAPTSSGFAAGVDTAHAARAAVVELLERDAFVITWLNRLAAPEIDLESAGGVTTAIARTFARWGTTLRAFLLPTDMPVVPMLVVALDETGEGPAAIVALGCGLRARAALEKAMFEMCQVHGPMQKAHRTGRPRTLNNYSDVRSLEDHAAYFFRGEHLHELDFLLGHGVTTSIDQVTSYGGMTAHEDLEALDAGIRAAGSRVFYRDVTTPDLRGYPIKVVRALATHVQPIHFGHGQERLGGRRIYELPVKLGLSNASVSETALNQCPHPLA